MIDFEEIEDMGYEDNTEESDTGFSIVSDLQAEWALKKISKATEEYNRLVNLANSEIESINTRVQELERKYNNDTAYLKSKLFEYFCSVEHKETKTQETYKLLSGTLTFKKPARKIDRPTDQRLLDALHQTGESEFIETVEKPKWAEYKKTLTITDDGKVVNANGELIDLETIDEPGKFDVKF